MPETSGEHEWVTRCRPRGRPLVIAHRGGAGLAPENTMAAFDQAAALGADGIELDVRLSRDGEVMVIHDADVARTTDATGPVAARTAAELAALDAGARFERDGVRAFADRGLGVPRLADVLARHATITCIVELKGDDVAIARAAVDVVRRASALDRVCFGGFSDAVLREARAADGRVCTSAARGEIRWALYRSYVRWPLGDPVYRAFQVPETARSTRVVSPRFIDAAHRAHRLVQVWTVNDPADMRRLAGWGVDAWITDRPDLALETAHALQAASPRRPPGSSSRSGAERVAATGR
jgi:glycerophosphoryl diester phosphodiesterase